MYHTISSFNNKKEAFTKNYRNQRQVMYEPDLKVVKMQNENKSSKIDKILHFVSILHFMGSFCERLMMRSKKNL